jgi:hypothetical protein
MKRFNEVRMHDKINSWASQAASDMYFGIQEFEAPQFLVDTLPMDFFNGSGFSMAKIGGYLSEFNMGMATAMLVDPYDEDSSCFI